MGLKASFLDAANTVKGAYKKSPYQTMAVLGGAAGSFYGLKKSMSNDEGFLQSAGTQIMTAGIGIGIGMAGAKLHAMTTAGKAKMASNRAINAIRGLKG
jgi:hypothetical protein